MSSYFHDGTWRIDAAFAGAIMLAAGAFYLGLIEPRQARVDVLRAQREELAIRQAEAEEKAGRALKLKAQHENLKARLTSVQVELKRVEDELNTRLKAFSDIVQGLKARGEGSAAMAINETIPATPQRNTQHTAVPIRVAGTGNFPAFAEFLASVHTRFKDVAVRGFRMSWSLTEPDEPPKFQFDLVWFAAPDTPARPAPRPGAAPAPRAEAGAGGAP